MKRFSLRFVVAVFTFIIGITCATFGIFNPNLHHTTENPVLIQITNESNVRIISWQIFLSFENQNLENINREQKDRLQDAIDKLIGKTTNIGIPKLISKISDEQRQIKYILIGESPLITIPGKSGLRIQLFNLEGKLLKSMSFDSGWRIALTDIKVNYSPKIDREIIEVNSEPVINGRDVVKQYYALIGEKIMLIRLEDSKGQPIRNVYGAPNCIIGLNITGRSEEEWKKTFESNDMAEILASLSWLNGIHWNPQQNQTENWYENINEAKLVEKVRSDENIKGRVKNLTKSKNSWLKDAATLAIKFEHYR
jgi:hypothetical protein